MTFRIFEASFAQLATKRFSEDWAAYRAKVVTEGRRSEAPEKEIAEAAEDLLRAGAELTNRVSRASGPTAQDVDVWLDRAVSLPVTQCRAIVATYGAAHRLGDAQRERLADAQQVLTAFPSDLRDITALRLPLEWAAVEGLLGKLRAPSVAEAVDRLGLAEDVAMIEAAHADFGEKLGLTGDRQGTEAPLAEWQKAYEALATVIGYHTRKHRRADHAGLLAAFDEQWHRQQEVAAADRDSQRSRAKPAVEPEVVARPAFEPARDGEAVPPPRPAPVPVGFPGSSPFIDGDR